METEKLRHFENLLSRCGIIIRPELKIVLENSLQLLKIKQKANKALLLGKIECLYSDFYLAMTEGYPENIEQKYFFYSSKGSEWILLQPPTDKKRCSAALKIQSRLTGDPNSVFEVDLFNDGSNEEVNADDEEAVDLSGAKTSIQINEEERISAFVQALVSNTWLKKERNDYLNSEITKFSGEIFEKAEWSVLKNQISNLDVESSICRSLAWPGACFFEDGMQQGNIYWGRGEINLDIPFMI
ncbi:MAG: Radial spoke head protein 9 [Paramarteilia canceri]